MACKAHFFMQILYSYGLNKGMMLYNFRNTYPILIKGYQVKANVRVLDTEFLCLDKIFQIKWLFSVK